MADLKEARVPDIGGYDGVPVIEVLVAVGDTVSKDQGLVTLESDKATMEVPSPFAGVIKELKIKLGDELSEGSVVALIEVAEAAAAAPAAPAAPEKAAATTTAAETGAKVEPVAVAAEPDKLAQREIAQERAAQVAAAAAPSAPRALEDKPGIDPEAVPPRSPPVDFNADSVLPSKVAYASPTVRVFARELGVDLDQVKGSERGGRISKEDVQRYVKAALSGGVPAGAAPAAAGGAGGGLHLLP